MPLILFVLFVLFVDAGVFREKKKFKTRVDAPLNRSRLPFHPTSDERLQSMVEAFAAQTEFQEKIMSDIDDFLNDIFEPSAASQAGAEFEPPAEYKNSKSVPLQVKAAIVYHQQADRPKAPTFHGRTNIVSMSGISVILEKNIFSKDDVTVWLSIPPRHLGGTQKFIQATAKMISTVFSSELDAFRVALNFLQFKQNGEEILKDVINAM